MTDGAPTDAWKEAAKKVHAGEEAKALSFFAVGVEGANFETPEQIAVAGASTDLVHILVHNVMTDGGTWWWRWRCAACP